MPSKKARRASPRPAPPPANKRQRPDSYRPNPPRGRSPDMYQFRGNSSRGDDGRRDNNRDPHRGGSGGGNNSNREFTFNRPGPSFEPPPADRHYPNRRASPPRGPRRDAKRNAQRGNQGSRGGWRKRGASERYMLHSRRETTPERLQGMNTGTSFKALEDLSDSGGEMDMSDNEASDADDRPSKRKRTVLSPSQDIPKWSNPDPYTALPPPDESGGKKKDVVKLIRKAKVAGEGDTPSQDAAADNADFISFNFDDDNDSEEDKKPLSRPSASAAPDTHRPSELTPWFGYPGDPPSDRAKSPPPPLADRIEGRGITRDEASSFRMPLPKTNNSKGNKLNKAGEVGMNTWPPTSNVAAVAGSKRRLDLDDAPPPGPQRGVVLPQAAPPHGKKRKRALPIDGSVVEEWAAVPEEDDRPWCMTDHSETKSMGLWLHKEVCDFYDYVRPYHFEAHVREDAIRRVSLALSAFHPNGRLFPFGSYAAGIYLPTADLDLVYVSNEFYRGGREVVCQTRNKMWKTMNDLVRRGVAKPGGEVIWGAKVPILKITDPVTNLRIDISFENMTGVVANQTFTNWKEEHPAMPILVTLVKQFLLMRDLNEVHTGGIGGFTVTCLVTSLLQHLPAVKSGAIRAEEHLGQVLMDFFDLYGNKFNYETHGITMTPPGYFPKPRDAKKDRLKIIDPNKPDNDISGGSAKVAIVFEAFALAAAKLDHRMAYLETLSPEKRRNESILATILGGNYRAFRYQRDHLKRIYDRQDNRDSLEEKPKPGLVQQLQALPAPNASGAFDNQFRTVYAQQRQVMLPSKTYSQAVQLGTHFHQQVEAWRTFRKYNSPGGQLHPGYTQYPQAMPAFNTHGNPGAQLQTSYAQHPPALPTSIPPGVSGSQLSAVYGQPPPGLQMSQVPAHQSETPSGSTAYHRRPMTILGKRPAPPSSDSTSIG